jgi:hypothetical protein
MRAVRSALVAAALSPLAFAASSNDWPTVKQDCAKMFHPPPGEAAWKAVMACGTDFFTARPVHLTVESIVPGGGFGLGPTISEQFNRGKWQRELDATGVGSFRQFWSTGAKFVASHDKFGAANSARDRFTYEVFANARDLPRMTYYGIGPNTSTTSLVNFQERDVTAGGDVFNPFSSWFAAGAKLESLWPEAGGVTEQGLQSITSRFTEATAPGLASQPNLIHYRFYGEPRRTRGKMQFDYKVGYDFYQDHDTGHYSFRRFDVNGIHTFHPLNPDNILTIHDELVLSGTSGNNVVPFYLQPTLGGSDIGGEPTLRGFADYRFRGPDLMLFQVQYDHRIWGPIGAGAFYDAGEVAARASDLSFATMRQSFGFGVSIWAGDRAVFRVYVGLGSGEGRHIYIGIPPL